MRFRLRTLMIVLTLAGVLSAYTRFYFACMRMMPPILFIGASGGKSN
jgi:hypothetical protein